MSNQLIGPLVHNIQQNFFQTIGIQYFYNAGTQTWGDNNTGTHTHTVIKVDKMSEAAGIIGLH